MNALKNWWKKFATEHETLAQFIVFFILSNGITVLQLILMPVFKWIFGMTNLVNQPFQFLQVGVSGGNPVYLFDYAGGAIQADGSGGGLAYFLAVEITLLIAQVINFFAQRNVTFKSNSSVWKAAFWYAVAYVVITILAAALQVVYKDPIYSFFKGSMGAGGETVADVITMIINAAISFWVFFPIFKVIFKQVPEDEETPEQEAAQDTVGAQK
ncbi:hypothetical protein [Schaalia sp. ZJ1691]|uniref:hypothetical protein n=1 Tax=Schaalia sp. ZJ1691 TaxID=2709404 RepID=UPI0013EAD75D|nr:hypothetical protein [Schaalia sp. ZJ1691]